MQNSGYVIQPFVFSRHIHTCSMCVGSLKKIKQETENTVA